MPNFRSKRQDFSPSCSSGGTWYACASGSKFVGCCASDPCSTGCSQGNIRPASFDSTYYGKFPDASCGSSSDFYTCASGDQTFWGCCKSNPCDQGLQCPKGDLVPALLDRPEQTSAYQPTGGTSSTSASATSSRTSKASITTRPASSSATTSTASSSANPSSTTTHVAAVTAVAAEADKTNQDTHTAAIAGGAAGGGVGIAILVGLLIYFVLHAKKSRTQHRDILERRQSNHIAGMIKKADMGGSPITEVPPVYASPNPNNYPYDPHNYVYQENSPVPYELSATPSSPRSLWKPHRHHRLSELSGETARRSEVESPMHPSPLAYSTPQSPRSTGGESPNWTTHPWERPPQQALGIWNENRDEILPRRDQHQFRGYHGV